MPELSIDSTSMFWGLTCVVGAVITAIALYIGIDD